MFRGLFHKYKHSHAVVTQLITDVLKVADCVGRKRGRRAREPAASGGNFGNTKSIHGPWKLRTLVTEAYWWP